MKISMLFRNERSIQQPTEICSLYSSSIESLSNARGRIISTILRYQLCTARTNAAQRFKVKATEHNRVQRTGSQFNATTSNRLGFPGIMEYLPVGVTIMIQRYRQDICLSWSIESFVKNYVERKRKREVHRPVVTVTSKRTLQIALSRFIVNLTRPQLGPRRN